MENSKEQLYRVIFTPDIESIQNRRKLLNKCKLQIGVFLFDGTIMCLKKKLEKELMKEGIQVDNTYVIKFKFIADIGISEMHNQRILDLVHSRHEMLSNVSKSIFSI